VKLAVTFLKPLAAVKVEQAAVLPAMKFPDDWPATPTVHVVLPGWKFEPSMFTKEPTVPEVGNS
jgi:hypothetical protein